MEAAVIVRRGLVVLGVAQPSVVNDSCWVEVAPEPSVALIVTEYVVPGASRGVTVPSSNVNEVAQRLPPVTVVMRPPGGP